MSDLDKLFKRLDELLDRVEKVVPGHTKMSTEPGYSAYRWSPEGLEGIAQFDRVEQAELLHLERQKNLLFKNTTQFLDDKVANNALLWGARGTGKSSLIKAQLCEFEDQGLCIVEIPKSATSLLFDVIRILAVDGRKFIVYLDDLSLSNRRHLMPESMQDNLDSTMVDGQLHPSDSIEEKISLSDRFGLWLSFHPFTQEQYLAVVEQAVKARGMKLNDEARTESIRFATQRGSRSGRIAVQFAAYWESLQ
jgi:predicted AAA+ superfamily ATPase